MRLTEKYPEGYYWARHANGAAFVVQQDGGQFYACGIREALDEEFKPEVQIIMPVPLPVH